MTPPRGWLSPHSIYNTEDKVYRWEDGDANTPVWTFPNLTGTIAISVAGNITIPATDDHSSGITKQQFVYNDLGTLVSDQTYRALYARYNVASTVPSNPTAEVTGIEGVAGSKINDEALTFRGGYFRTYIDTDAEPTATMRTAIGCEISARAAYLGAATLVTAEGPGTAFIGARIWMAPYFTDASIGNVNNFHALWILNEADGKTVTNAIKIDSSTYGGGFSYCFYTDAGRFYQILDGAVNGSGLQSTDTAPATDWDIMFVRAEDYRTLISADLTYRGGYFRYNVRSTTPSNPTAEVTGVEGVVGWYINPADNSTTIRGGHFRNYITAGNRVRTAVGADISSRAGLTTNDCVADPGTAFIGARIWLAPYFTLASIGNINNFHGLLILNEAVSRFVTNAIKIDATTYHSGFTYSFNADSGKFYLSLDGTVAGSGLVAGETVTTSGDDWHYVRVRDYRTLTSDQVYNAGFFRYDVRATTPGSPQCEVRGLEAVGSTYVADGNLLSLFGAVLRTYIQPGTTASAKTSIGAEISARAAYAPAGGVDCVALDGTCFTGARIYMAPYFTAATLNNINNFWGLWIFGEHASQRNGDAAIFINDGGGGFTAGLKLGGLVTNVLDLQTCTATALAKGADGKGGLTVGVTDITADLTADAYARLDIGAQSYKVLLWAYSP